MHKRADISKKVDEAMDSILNIVRANPQPFFYTRLEARLRKDERSAWEKLNILVTKPVFAIIIVALILLINVFVIFKESANHGNQPDRTEIASTEDLRNTSFYDIENVQP